MAYCTSHLVTVWLLFVESAACAKSLGIAGPNLESAAKRIRGFVFVAGSHRTESIRPDISFGVAGSIVTWWALVRSTKVSRRGARTAPLFPSSSSVASLRLPRGT